MGNWKERGRDKPTCPSFISDLGVAFYSDHDSGMSSVPSGLTHSGCSFHGGGGQPVLGASYTTPSLCSLSYEVIVASCSYFCLGGLTVSYLTSQLFQTCITNFQY